MLNMTQNRSAAIVFPSSIAALFVLWVFASGAQAQPAQAAKPISITGVYNGTYAGEQGPIKFKLSLTQQDNGTLAGEFTLYVAEGSATNAYTCDLRGQYVRANRRVQLVRGKWKTPPPGGIDMPGMNGVFDPDGGNGAGQISGTLRARPGPKFEAIRDADESAKMAAVIADKPAGGRTAGRPGRAAREQPTAAKPAAPPAPGPTPPRPPPSTASILAATSVLVLLVLAASSRPNFLSSQPTTDP